MLRFKNWAIVMEGEYPVVSTIKVYGKDSKRMGEEYITPTYFPRDMLGAFSILHRVTTTDATRDCKTLEEAIKAIDENHNELMTLVREQEC